MRDVVLHPLLGGGDVPGDGGEEVVGEAEHDLDAGVALRVVEAVVLEQLHGDAAGEQLHLLVQAVVLEMHACQFDLVSKTTAATGWRRPNDDAFNSF